MDPSRGTPAMEKVLSLYELRTLIYSFLDPDSIKSCRLINREWNTTLLPFHFRRVAVSPWKYLPPHLGLYTRHIRHLSVPDDYFPHVLSFPGLDQVESLHLWQSFRFDATTEEQFAEEVAQQTVLYRALDVFLSHQCHHLKTLSIEDMENEVLPGIFDTMVKGCPRLEKFIFKAQVVVALCDRDLIHLWKSLCQLDHLQELEFHNLTIRDSVFVYLMQQFKNESNPTFRDQVIIKATRFTLGRHSFYGCTGTGILALLQFFPDLEYFSCDTWKNFPCLEFYKVLMKGAWKRLCSLSGATDSLEDHQLAQVIQGMARVEMFGTLANFGMKSLQALQVHPFGFSVVRELQLGGTEPSSVIIQTILEQCRSLEVFSAAASALESADIQRGQPWTCHRSLKSLRVHFLLSKVLGNNDNDDGIQEQTEEEHFDQQNGIVIEALSRLTRLKYLWTTNGNLRQDASGTEKISASVDFEKGILKLESLKCLQEVSFVAGSHPMRLVAMERMLDHWPRLRKLTIRLQEQNLSEDVLPKDLARRVKARGIEILSPERHNYVPS